MVSNKNSGGFGLSLFFSILSIIGCCGLGVYLYIHFSTEMLNIKRQLRKYNSEKVEDVLKRMQEEILGKYYFFKENLKLLEKEINTYTLNSDNQIRMLYGELKKYATLAELEEEIKKIKIEMKVLQNETVIKLQKFFEKLKNEIFQQIKDNVDKGKKEIDKYYNDLVPKKKEKEGINLPEEKEIILTKNILTVDPEEPEEKKSDGCIKMDNKIEDKKEATEENKIAENGICNEEVEGKNTTENEDKKEVTEENKIAENGISNEEVDGKNTAENENNKEATEENTDDNKKEENDTTDGGEGFNIKKPQNVDSFLVNAIEYPRRGLFLGGNINTYNKINKRGYEINKKDVSKNQEKKKNEGGAGNGDFHFVNDRACQPYFCLDFSWLGILVGISPNINKGIQNILKNNLDFYIPIHFLNFKLIFFNWLRFFCDGVLHFNINSFKKDFEALLKLGLELTILRKIKIIGYWETDRLKPFGNVAFLSSLKQTFDNFFVFWDRIGVKIELHCFDL